ncbi:hypothetical protein [Propionibacterium freudenreichii]|nr:hypothetical protein [Propionibacterium freudenreichii]
MAHHKDDPETMARMRTWLAAVAGELGLDDGLPAEDVCVILPRPWIA